MFLFAFYLYHVQLTIVTAFLGRELCGEVAMYSRDSDCDYQYYKVFKKDFFIMTHAQHNRKTE